MQYIPEDTIRELRNNLPLLRLIISRKVKLDDLGWGLCPFHKEKSPSFHTFFGLDRARFHCFGCGATGDIFNYLKKSDNIDFKLAVIKLKYILRNSGISVFPLPTEPSEPAQFSANSAKFSANINPAHANLVTPNLKDCYLNCENYKKLEDLYKAVWEENQKFRVWLNLGEFKIKGESK